MTQSAELEGDLNVPMGMLCIQAQASVDRGEQSLQELEAEVTASPLPTHLVEPELDSSVDSSS